MTTETNPGEAAEENKELELAGWWSRVAASLLDAVITMVPLAIISIVAAGMLGAYSVPLGAVAFYGAPFVACAVYWVVTMQRKGVHNGQSFGKQIVGITVIKEDGTPVEAGYTFVRQTLVIGLLFGFLGFLLLLIPYVLNYLWALWDPKNQCLHDKIVGSYVVRVEENRKPKVVLVKESQ